MRFVGIVLFGLLSGIALLLGACTSGSGVSPISTQQPVVQATDSDSEHTLWPSSLPADGVQPWETLDGSGKVSPGGGHSASAISGDSEFTPGVERYLDGGTTADNGEACTLTSAAGSLSYAIYRLPLGGAELGTAAADVNILSGTGYYLGLSDYGNGVWQWFGPFRDSHVRVSAVLERKPGSSYVSPLGNAFICIAAWGGSRVDVVGVSADPVDPADTTPPPAPGTPTVTPVNGGLLLEWLPVSAGDLAGYRIYHSTQEFYDGLGSGVQEAQSLEGLTSHLLHVSGLTYLRISAVDISGNESALSNQVSATPLAGIPAGTSFTVSAPSGALNDPVTLIASGGDIYDFDLDGDGIYDVTDTATASQGVDTTSLGMIRPHVRAYASGVMTAQGGASVIITGNSRPVASATADPQSGAAPLLVSFTGIAEDLEDESASLVCAWDLDGDGIYEPDTNLLALDREYTDNGIYGVKFRVTDSGGAWDVDTVPVLVLAIDPTNNPPVADLQGAPTTGYVPLTVNFDASGSTAGGDPGDSIVEYAWDWDGNGGYDEFTDTATISHIFTSAGSPVVRLRVEDSHGARATDTLTITVNLAGNNPPTAALQGFPVTGQTPLDVEFDASGSDAGGDPGDSIVRYDWDFDGDGLFEVYDGGAQPVSYTFVEPGTHFIAVRVTDSYGAQASQSTGISAYSWTNSTADSQDNVGTYVSMKLVNGNPAIAYFDVTNLDLKYIRASNPQGTAWGAPVTVVANGDSGKYCSLAVVNGNPAISYWFASSDTLRFVRATDTSGASWGASVVADATVGSGRFSCLGVAAGVPLIAYYFITSGDLRVAVADDSIGSTWSTVVTADSTNNVGQYCSLAIVNGSPAISYYDATNGNLMYTRATDAFGWNWGGAKLTVESANDIGLYTSLAIVNGNPAISFYDQTNGDLRFIRATDGNGGGWGAGQIVDSSNNTGRFTSMAIIGNYPAISYASLTNGDAMYVQATNVAGSAWGVPSVVDDFNTTGDYTSLLPLNSQPAISYYYSSGGDLKFALGNY